MAKNRLQLNFQLESAADRTAFVEEYLNTITFTPTAEELETISNYILWGKNEKGKNAQQEGEVKLKEWAPERVESLEGLMELPGFNERQLKSLAAPQPRIPRVVFDRGKALESAPDWLRPFYEDLFREIDTLELVINYYDLWTGKRKLPPRASLLHRFSAAEQQELNERALKLSQFKYLKLKHLLVDLRNEQYAFHDAHCGRVLSHAQPEDVLTNIGDALRLDEDIPVLPLGLINRSDSFSLQLFNNLLPGTFSKDELRRISDMVWSAKQVSPEMAFDFRNPNHVWNAYMMKEELMDEAAEDPSQIYGAAAAMVDTLEYYEQRANLSDLQKDLLRMKLEKKQNYDIAMFLNQKYGKSYNENYISTIFHQKVLTQIAAAAQEHYDIACNVFFPENFKICKDCNRILLLNSNNFVRQKKSKDGFAPRCKRCERKKRSRYK